MLRLALVLGAAAFLVVNAVVSAAVAGFAGRLLRAGRGEDPAGEGRLLWLRILPGVVSIAFVLGLFLPSFLVLEPRGSGEAVGVALGMLSLGALAVIGAALLRGFGAWRATRRLVRRWMQEAEPVHLAGAAEPAYRIRDGFPVVAVVGVLRPRLFVAAQVLDALSADELVAAVAHETAHLHARDNLKRLLLRCCPDVLAWLPAGPRLEREWARASEAEADSRAAGDNPARAATLAAALIKVARLVPPGARATCAASALHDGDDVTARVRRLLGLVTSRNQGRRGPGRLLAAITLLALAPLLPQILVLVHRLTEAVVLLGR